MAADGILFLYVVLIMIVFGVIISSMYYYLFYYRHRLSSSQQQQKQTGQQRTMTKSLQEDNVDPNTREVSIYPDDDLHLQQSTIISNLLKNRKAAAESSTKSSPL